MTFRVKRFPTSLLTLTFSLCTQIACKDRKYGEKPSQIESLMDPHKLPEKGPWFEGWYVRITPVTGSDRSLGAIVGSYLPRGELREAAEQKGLRGYAAVLDGGSLGSPLRAFESFPLNSELYLNKNDIVNRDPLPMGSASFRWSADGIGEFSEAGSSLQVGNGVQLKARWTDNVAWSGSGLGPEGVISLFRAFPLHWFVYSLGSKVEFEAVVPDLYAPEKIQKISGRGFAHIEKNWGVSFPESYIWLQSQNLEQNRTLAIAGGRPLKLAGLQPEAWLVGYRSELYKQDFAPQNPGTFFESRVDACDGRFELQASFMNRRLIVSAQAQRRSFGEIAIPKESGFEKGGSEQSFQTQIVAQLFEVAPLGMARGGERLLEQTIFTTGALEFGGGYMCEKKP